MLRQSLFDLQGYSFYKYIDFQGYIFKELTPKTLVAARKYWLGMRNSSDNRFQEGGDEKLKNLSVSDLFNQKQRK